MSDNEEFVSVANAIRKSGKRKKAFELSDTVSDLFTIDKKGSPLKKNKKEYHSSGSEDDVADEAEDEPEKKTVDSAKKVRLLSEEETREKNERTIFVGNVPKTWTKKRLEKVFSDCGQIESLRFRSIVPDNVKLTKKVAAITNKISEKSHSINAYVVFKDKESINEAIEKNGLEADGHHLRVDFVTKRKYDENKTVFVGNLPFNVKEDDIRKVFEKIGKVATVRVVRDSETGMSKGFGFVEFANADSVMITLEQQCVKTSTGRELRVKPLLKPKRPKKDKSKLKSKNKTSPLNPKTASALRRIDGKKEKKKSDNELHQEPKYTKPKKDMGASVDKKRLVQQNKKKKMKAKKVQKKRRIVSEILNK